MAKKQPLLAENGFLTPHNTMIIADAYPMCRESLRLRAEIVMGQMRFHEVDCFSALQDTLAAHPDTRWLLLDLQLPGFPGFSGITLLKGMYPSLSITALSSHKDATTITRVQRYGACALISRDASLSAIGEAMQALKQGRRWFPEEAPPASQTMDHSEAAWAQSLASLTAGQLRVLDLLSQGLLNKQIAYELSISDATVKAHISSMMRTFKVSNRTQLVLAFHKVGLPVKQTASASL